MGRDRLAVRSLIGAALLFAAGCDSGGGSGAPRCVVGDCGPGGGGTQDGGAPGTCDPACGPGFRCQGATCVREEPPPGPKNSITGRVSVFSGSASAAFIQKSARATGASGERFVNGEIIVRFLEQAPPQPEIKAMLGRVGIHEAPRQVLCASRHICLLRFRELEVPSTYDRASTLALVARARKMREVEWATPNRLRTAQRVPNDEYFNAQWHYYAMNLPAAWDITTGSDQVVVAILDTGGTPQHPDLVGRMIPGFDMITDPAVSGDGDGRDADANDEGDAYQGRPNSWHGTHVAGTIGAVTNDGKGVAGVDWACRLQPVRVLGRGGGTEFDIASGIFWAAGLDVPGTPRNPTPAKVLNMSLGGEGQSAAEQEAVTAATRAGAIMVVAAGNDNADAARYSPASLDNLITVGATRFDGTRASYSNYGDVVEIVAPGGEMAVDQNGDNYPDGVLSTLRDQTGRQATWDFYQGTSMASPHVAGLVALMVSVKPDLTLAEATRILQETANPDARCQEGCGAGLVDAAAAVAAARGGGLEGPNLSLGANRIAVGTAPSGTLRLSNRGTVRTAWRAQASGAQGDKLSLRPPSGAIDPGQDAELVITVNRDGLADGEYAATLAISSDAGETAAQVTFRVGEAPTFEGQVAVGAFLQTGPDQWELGGSVLTSAADGFAYTIPDLAPGEYLVVGLIDENGDGNWAQPEPIGIYPSSNTPELVTLAAEQSLNGIDFTVAPSASFGGGEGGAAIGDACNGPADCTGIDQGICAPPDQIQGGYCTRDCTQDGFCPGGSDCFGFDQGNGQQTGLCLKLCQDSTVCRANEGYSCQASGNGLSICAPPGQGQQGTDCTTLYNCVVACAADQSCQVQCYNAGAPDARSAFDALVACLNQFCAASATPEELQQCAGASCQPQLQACFN